MPTLFNGDNSDSDGELKINKDYANTYSSWRQKEELNKLATKYGEETDSSSSEDDEVGNELTEEFEKEFYKTLACLKNKDPKIYDEKTTFFQNTGKNAEENESKKKGKKEKALTLRDYERKIVVERGGKFSDSEDEETVNKKKDFAPTYAEEQRQLKESLSAHVHDEEQDEDTDLLKPKEKTETEKHQEEEDYKEWLKGQQLEIDEEQKKELKPLRDFWNDPNLDPNEKFLRDYILNNKFLEKDNYEDSDYDHVVHDSDENLSADEKNIEKQEEFEHKYNFRFEEPDQEFIKRYPRTMENSLRKKDTRRAEKRAELRKRKEDEKLRKQEELKRLKALKRKEIEEKIEKLKEVTGNDDLGFDNSDLEADFDPEAHDKRMQEIFNDDYYAGAEEDQKPEFPDIDEELGIEPTWDKYDPEGEELVADDYNNGHEPHCEDPDFNMDADYDPSRKDLQTELAESSRKKKRRRRSKFAELISKEKPKFDPKVYSSYEEYFDQYYSLDYEDMIGDLPCRFKYRKVVPNDYGLSVEEILMADDKELNKWCPLRKALRYKNEREEIEEVKAYQNRARDENRKRKLLSSLYTPPETEANGDGQSEGPAKKKRRRKKKSNQDEINTETSNSTGDGHSSKAERVDDVEAKPSGKMEQDNSTDLPSAMKLNSKASKENSIVKNSVEEKSASSENSAKKNESNRNNGSDSQASKKNSKKNKRKEKYQAINKKNNKRQKTNDPIDQIVSMNPERLKTYGLNAKKFKNKLKYGMKK